MTDLLPESPSGPYGVAAGAYWGAGWRGILPLPAKSKKPVPKGWTGAGGAWPSYPDIQTWTDGPEGTGNLALRLPRHVIGIDVDNYDEKRGGDTLASAVQRWGELPATWRSSSRDDGVSGISLFTVPEGLAWPGELGPATEVIQFGHRYVVAWPSVHPEGGTYRWYSPDGAVVINQVPQVDELPPLPDSWITGLTGGLLREDVAKADFVALEVANWLSMHGLGQPCRSMARACERYVNELADAGISRHGVALRATARIVRMIAEGHHGGLDAIARARDAFDKAVERTPARERDPKEWARLIDGAVQLAAVETVTERDPCDDPFAGLLTTRSESFAIAPTAAAVIPSSGTSPNAQHEDAGASGEPLTQREQLLAQEVERERAKRAAKRLLDAEELGSRPDIGTLLVDGASFILDAPDRVPTIWGSGQEVAWAEGESLMLVGPPGVGKTTLAGQVIRARLGLSDDPVLGMSVVGSLSKVLYLAMDRPAQAARALRRLFDEHDRAALADRLVIWKGPPPADVAREPETLVNLARQAGADTIVVDSLKDAAIGLSADDVAAGYNRARQAALAVGIQVLELHHLVKRGPSGAKPNTLADVYGSAWLTAGAGSVILLWGAAGDPIVEFVHLKQPGEPIGPLKVIHDHTTGMSSIWHTTDILALAQAAGSAGITARAAALAMFETDKPSASEIEKARRKLDALVKGSHLICREGKKGAGEGAPIAAVWTITLPLTGPHAPDLSSGPHGAHASSRNPGNTPHGGPHGTHGVQHASSLTKPTVPLGTGVVSEVREEIEDIPRSLPPIDREAGERRGRALIDAVQRGARPEIDFAGNIVDTITGELIWSPPDAS